MNETYWWDVKVSFIHVDEQGKKNNIKMLVQATSITEVEAKVTRAFEDKDYVMEFMVTSATTTKIIDIFGTSDEETKYYDVVVEFDVESETSGGEVKIKKRTEKYITITSTVREAEEIMVDKMKDSMEDHRVKDVKTTTYVAHI